MDNGMDQFWVISGTGGEWAITSIGGFFIADSIPSGEVAEHICREHNEFVLKMKEPSVIYLPGDFSKSTLVNVGPNVLDCMVCYSGPPEVTRKSKVGQVWVCPSCETIHYLKYGGYTKKTLVWTKREKEMTGD